MEELALDFEENYERALRCGLTPEEAWKAVTENQPSWSELAAEFHSVYGEPQPVRPKVTRKATMFSRVCDGIWRDLRYGMRQLYKSPAFTIIAVLMLALGIGANTAIFSLLHAILLRSLPVRQPEQLVFFGKASAEGDTPFLPHHSTEVFSYPFFREFQRTNRVFSEVAAIQSFLVTAHGRVAHGAELEKLDVELVSGNYFHTLGVNAIRGRLLSTAEDQTPGGHPLAVASYSWWQKRFSKDPAVAGKTIIIGSTVYTVIGVAPPGFFGVTVGQSPDLWIPLTMQKEILPDRSGLDQNLFQCLHLIGRLKLDIAIGQAQANTNVLFRQILRSYLGPQPTRQELDSIRHAFVELTPAATGRSNLRQQFSAPLEILMMVVALVLLIACANVANLLLARAAVRQREIAVRMSLGAARPRLIRQLLAESGLLGVTGAVLGVLLAWGASRLLVAMVSAGSTRVPLEVSPHAPVLGFTIIVTLVTVLLFGTVPALRATALELAPSLRGGRGISANAARTWLTRGLVVGQVALSLVLLSGAGLFLRSLSNLLDVNVGFDRQNVLRMHIDPAAAGYHTDQRLESLMERIEERVRPLSGVEAASFARSVFDGGGWSEDDVNVPGRPAREHDRAVDFNDVGPQYFEVMRMPIVLGRALSPRDNATSPKVAVINQTMAAIYFPGGSPLGRTFSVGDGPELQNIQVAGVVKDAKYMDLEEQQMPAAFFPHAQHFDDEYLRNFVVRYRGDLAFVVPAIRKAISDIDPDLPVGDIRMLSQMVDDFTLDRRLVAQLSTFFGALAALLAASGIYGVLSYSIAQRTNEFGIRMALGATRTDVLWAVVRDTLSLTLAGVGIGLALALASSRLVRTLLFGVEPQNPFVIALAAAAMIVVALFAGCLPARRATRIDPSVALRYE